jgi:beta-phosphoglucomutase family hydrolase
MQDIPIYNNIKGLIFDLDGTIADTMPAHFLAWRNATKNYGIEFTIELFESLAGIPLYLTVEKLNQIFNKNIDPKELGNLKESMFLKTLSQTKIVEPVAKLIKDFHGKLPMSVGTGGQRHIAWQTLKAIGMKQYFDILVSSDDIDHPKPHPETFLKCASQMGVVPSKCQVFEDGILGIEAAHKAGMQVTDVKVYYNVTIGQENNHH